MWPGWRIVHARPEPGWWLDRIAAVPPRGLAVWSYEKLLRAAAARVRPRNHFSCIREHGGVGCGRAVTVRHAVLKGGKRVSKK